MKPNKIQQILFCSIIFLNIFIITPQFLWADKIFVDESFTKIKYKNKIYNYILEINPYIPKNIYTAKLLTKKYNNNKNRTALIIIKSNNSITNNKLTAKNNIDDNHIDNNTKNLIKLLKQKLNIHDIALLHYSDNNTKNYHILLYIN